VLIVKEWGCEMDVGGGTGQVLSSNVEGRLGVGRYGKNRTRREIGGDR
jgi:hypothetical protein